MITSKALYSFSSAWLTKTDRKRLDGFEAKCIRQILRIPPAFVSRVSNTCVLEKSEQAPCSSQLLRQQLLLFGKIGRLPNNHVLRKPTFEPDAVSPATRACERKRGRPKQEWAAELYKLASPYFESAEYFMTAVADPLRWRSFVLDFINGINNRDDNMAERELHT